MSIVPILQSGGQLENDEMTATKIAKLVHTAYKIPVTPDRKDPLKRVSGITQFTVFFYLFPSIK